LRRFHGLTQPYAVVQRFLWQHNTPPPKREEHPAVLVTHDQAGFYCAWRGARLPREEEWERASRGPQGNTYPWGKLYDGFRVYGRVRRASDTATVGSLPQGNAREGFTDMGGHVWEWTSTPWRGRKDHYVVKGNGWDGRGGFGRGAAHESRARDVVDVTLGFRCAADL
jgi:formylglycine-generating enzyme required for sulfatase activity